MLTAACAPGEQKGRGSAQCTWCFWCSQPRARLGSKSRGGARQQQQGAAARDPPHNPASEGAQAPTLLRIAACESKPNTGRSYHLACLCTMPTCKADTRKQRRVRVADLARFLDIYTQQVRKHSHGIYAHPQPYPQPQPQTCHRAHTHSARAPSHTLTHAQSHTNKHHAQATHLAPPAPAGAASAPRL